MTQPVDHFKWNWTDFCPTGLTPFIANSNDLMPCFQQMCLQLPVYFIFAAISAYNFGFNLNQSPVTRNRVQLRLIGIRMFAALILAFSPVARFFSLRLSDPTVIHPIDVILLCTQCVMWIVHIGYLLSLRQSGEISHRGPLFVNVIWTTIVVLDVVWLRSSTRYSYWPWSVGVVVLDLIYFLTFLPSGKATRARRRITQHEEQEALLSDSYVQFNIHANELTLGHAQDEANFASKMLFYWVNPLIAKGLEGNLKKIEDLFDLPDCLNITRISEKLQLKIYQTKSVFRALHRAFAVEFYFIGVYRFIADAAGFAGPLLLGGLLRENTTENSGTDIHPYYYALGLFASTFISAFFGTHFNWRMAVIGMKMRIGVVSAIYRKALEARGLEDARPEILNLMSTDTDRIVNSCVSFHSLWSIPFQLFTTLYLLYTQLGVAFVAGVIFAAALIPLNRWLAVKIGKYSQGLMTAKDARLSATNETISGAKQIKLHAWEDIFINKIKKLRKTEVDYLAKRKYLDALCVYFWATTPVLMCLLTFGVSVLLGNPLTAATTYTSVALLNMLIGPLNAFPWVLNGLIEAWISVKRVQELIDLTNLDFSSYYNPVKIAHDAPALRRPPVIQLKNATFEYDSATNDDHGSFQLKANIELIEGELTCVEGPVGGGKSTLIAGIVGNVNCVEGEVCAQDFNSGFGYVPQSAWLQRGTIRENIIWGAGYNEQRYMSVLQACALGDDLEALGGDLVGVGENGRTLSGGQRARVSLARAIYQDKKVYLLDDILASLDAHVANHVIKYCIFGLLKNKTRLIVTNHPAVLSKAFAIYHVENGRLTPRRFSSEDWDNTDGYGDFSYFDLTDYDRRTVSSESDSALSKSVMSTINLLGDESDDRRSVDSLMVEESREYGNLSLSVISTYWKAMTNSLGVFVLLFVVLMQISRNLSDAWLAHWVTVTTVGNDTNTTSGIFGISEPTGNESLTFYLGIYTGLAVTNSVITLARAFLFAYAGIRAAKFIHDNLLNRLVYTKFHFFDVTSVGRIMNRFSSDTYTVDDSLPFILNIFLAQAVSLIGAILISLYAMPWLGLVVIPMVPIYISIQYRYRHSSRDIKRLSSNALSPLYTHFTETLQGMATIRAMRASSRFQRDFHVKLEESIKAQLSASAAQQWLALRLQLLGALLVGGAGLLAAITSAHATSPGLVGLAISYALSITGLLGGVLNAFAETEQEFVAVERIGQYLQLEGEDNADGSVDPPFWWPSQGAIQFNHVSLKYREHLQSALVDFNLNTAAFERIAVVGRTGAGKSSVLAALLRVAPLYIGEISIDCINLRTLSLRLLRDRIVIIPQEPFLFEGTVRENLDPKSKYIESEIWNALTNCLATPLVQALGGLSGRIEKCGSNLSAGQRQLLCLARALLKKSKIVCIDESTSNLDTDSEAAIQIALRNQFKSSTILYIAHRLKGLQTMDRIIVMDAGRIVEEGTPKQLAEDSNSIFYSMLKVQQIKDYE